MVRLRILLSSTYRGLLLRICNVEQTAHVVVPHAIQVLKAKGYRLVTVAECLGMPAYQSVGSPQSVSLGRLCLRMTLPDIFLSGLLDMLKLRTT